MKSLKYLSSFMLVCLKMSQKQLPFGEQIQKLRTAQNLSQLDVSRRSKQGGGKGISDGYVSQIESGQILPETISVQKLAAIARGLNVPPGTILTLALGNVRTENEDTLMNIQEYLKVIPENRKIDVLLILKTFYEYAHSGESDLKPEKSIKLPTINAQGKTDNQNLQLGKIKKLTG